MSLRYYQVPVPVHIRVANIHIRTHVLMVRQKYPVLGLEEVVWCYPVSLYNEVEAVTDHYHFGTECDKTVDSLG